MKLREHVAKAEHYLDEYKRRTKEKLGLFETSIVYPYRGYGNDSYAVLKGRVLEKEKTIHGDDGEDRGLFFNALRFLKRYESDEIPGVTIKGVFAGCEEIVTSNEDGFFEFHFEYDQRPVSGWHDIVLEVIHSDYKVPIEKYASAEILIPHEKPVYGIISDVDDTLIESNATNLFDRIQTMLSHTARSRPVFDGAKELYTAFTGNNKNPLWFVSGSSYNLHDLLFELCHYNEIPKAPFLLRDLGLTDSKWIKQDSSPYKMKHIRHIMDMYPDLDFILLGDSGQKDPEIYSKVVKEYPNRVLSIYIRHVVGEDRLNEIQSLTSGLSVPVKIIRNSDEAIHHAEKNGLI